MRGVVDVQVGEFGEDPGFDLGTTDDLMQRRGREGGRKRGREGRSEEQRPQGMGRDYTHRERHWHIQPRAHNGPLRPSVPPSLLFFLALPSSLHLTTYLIQRSADGSGGCVRAGHENIVNVPENRFVRKREVLVWSEGERERGGAKWKMPRLSRA